MGRGPADPVGATGPGPRSNRRPLLWLSVSLEALFTYEAVLRAALVGLVALPLIPGGLKVLTAILAAFSIAHAWYSLGGRLTAVFFALSATISWAFEQAGVMTGLVFGPYHYTEYLGGKIGDVPLLIPLAWFMMIYPSYVIAKLVLEGRASGPPGSAWGAVRLAGVAAFVMTAWDLVIDPILSGPSARAWIWEGGGPYFGVPIHNYLGWLVTTFTVYVAFLAVERGWAATAGRSPNQPHAIGVTAAALPVAAYGLMLIADLLSGAAPAGLAVIGPLVMGPPCVVAAWRLSRSGVGAGSVVVGPTARDAA